MRKKKKEHFKALKKKIKTTRQKWLKRAIEEEIKQMVKEQL